MCDFSRKWFATGSKSADCCFNDIVLALTAAELGKKVAVLDFVDPSSQGKVQFDYI